MRKTVKICWLLLVGISMGFLSYAQSNVQGTVVDTDNAGLAGVTVSIKGGVVSVTTDENGKFSIAGALPVTLEFSYVGYDTKEQTITAATGNIISLTKKDNDLDEVVIVGYGQQKKVTLTGAIATVGTKELRQSPVANLSNALAGRLPGLITLQTSGEPGYDGAQLWIRGMATFSGSTSPLILVDGVERSFSSLDANEVESISILKDASSTAVYGVRGANGVVLVTTRRGRDGAPNISFTAQSGIQSPTRLPKYLDSYDALSLFRQALINDEKNYSMYTDEYLNKFRDRSKPAYQYLYPNTNWLDEMLKPTSMMNQGNLNVSGGNNRVRYFVSLSYLRQNGLYKYEDQIKDYDIQARSDRYNFRSNIDINVTKNLSLELNLGTVIRDNNYPNVSAYDMFSMLQATPPWMYPLTNPDGSVPHLDSKPHNPYGQLTQRGYQRNFWNNTQSTAGFLWKLPSITEGLSLRGRLSFDMDGTRNVTRAKNVWNYQWTIADENETDLSKGVYRRIFEGTNTLSYGVAANSSRRTLVELSANYDRTFNSVHQVTGLLLYTQQSFFSAATAYIAGLPMKYNGLVGRATYGYDGRFFGEVNFGYNGSENFPKGQRYDLFPAVSASWMISREKFMESLDKVSLFKLRASYGIVGNDQIGGQRFLYQSTWTQGAGGYQFGRDYTGVYYGGAAEERLGTTYVTWEKSRKFNIGVDLGFFNDRLTFTGDYFIEKRFDILSQSLTVPQSLGLTSNPWLNLGEVQNKGFELEAQYRKQYNNWGYFIKGNVSFARNKILFMDEPALTGREYFRRTGRRISEQYGLIALGLFQSQEDIDKSPDQSAYGIIRPGDIKYKDMNGDGVIDALDRAYTGKESVPHTMTGVTLGFNYKQFDISVLFQGAFGGNVWLYGDVVWPFSGDVGVMADVKDNHWMPDNTDVKYPRLSSSNNVNNNQTSTYWIMSRDYLRLKNAEIGYTLPAHLSKRAGIKNLRVFVTAINLVTWDKLKIFDPEMPNESRNYPQQKVVNFGLNLGF